MTLVAFLRMRAVFAGIRMHGFYSKLSLCEGSGLVKYNGLDLGEDVHIAGSLDEDSLS